MATTHLENQLHSAQKNLLLLQREHASTLSGLHAEIRRLQQRCTDLTYELTLKSSEQTGDAPSSSSELQRRCQELEAQLRAKEQEHGPAREKQHKVHVGVAHRIHHAAQPQAQPEVETLAVDQVNGGKVVRKNSGTDRTV
uniref:Coiled-coil domain containing 92 n=1 Tax=Molossus molossus TaxID=27622 RepID=A0A7J8BWQ4_MOLMO|nr:coiled-coil domain containing 92 [Molossus molossus]